MATRVLSLLCLAFVFSASLPGASATQCNGGRRLDRLLHDNIPARLLRSQRGHDCAELGPGGPARGCPGHRLWWRRRQRRR
ncbi:hypothetical protein BKA93DRAFT_768884 [Sparassis latifolia]